MSHFLHFYVKSLDHDFLKMNFSKDYTVLIGSIRMSIQYYILQFIHNVWIIHKVIPKQIFKNRDVISSHCLKQKFFIIHWI